MSNPEKRIYELRDLVIVGIAIGSLLIADKISSLEQRVSYLEDQQQVYAHSTDQSSLGAVEVDSSCLKLAPYDEFSPNNLPKESTPITTTTSTSLPQPNQLTTTIPKIKC